MFKLRHNSLLWKIQLATAIAVSVVFAATGWMVQRYATSVSEHSLEEEIRTSLQAYESLWKERVHNLATVSRVISSMSDVRAAFMTRDQATIRDMTEQLWSNVSANGASFSVVDPTGEFSAVLGKRSDFEMPPGLIRAARVKFPEQAEGYVADGQRLFYVVLTPVYVDAGNGPGLIDVLVVAVEINDELARELKVSTYGSEFAFVSGGRAVASTVPGVKAEQLGTDRRTGAGAQRISCHGEEYLLLGTDLHDIFGAQTGKLFIARPLSAQKQVFAALRRLVAVFWVIGIGASLVLTYLLARRILEPVKRLDKAAAEVMRHNYDYRVPVETNDELGRLAKTFNDMCDSIRTAREDLIRQEQIATIGRLSGSIVHDLRNPLAAIYGGAEMLVDAGLSEEQQRRLAASIYNASRRIQELLQELLDVSRAKTRPAEFCRLIDIAEAAKDAIGRTAELQGVSIDVNIPDSVYVMASRDRLERVYLNLIGNSIDAMPDGGHVWIRGREEDGWAIAELEDTGPGIAEEVWANLFRPFASFKKNGLGLGLALSRQTLLDNGGDLWADKKGSGGAKFVMSLPAVPPPGLTRSGEQGERPAEAARKEA